MKRNILLKMGLIGCCLLALCDGIYAQADSQQANRYVTRATMYGIGYTNVFDTYLSPQEYKGIDFRISRETMRMTKLLDGNVSVQNFFQANIGYTHNHAENNNTFNGLVNWNYGLHYQFRITENFKLLAGALADIKPAQYEQSGFGKSIHQSGCFCNGHLACKNKELSSDVPLSGECTGSGGHVLTSLRTILL